MQKIRPSIALSMLVAVAFGATAASVVFAGLPVVTSGARPGPDVLYAPPPAAPQLENRDARFTAAPLLVSGQEAYVNGEYLYQDFLYDDFGSDTNAMGDFPLSPRRGDITYPTNVARYGNNAADIVEFRIAVDPTEVAYRVTMNTLLEADSTIVAIAWDTDQNVLTGLSTLPRDPGALFPGTDEVIFIWGTGAEHVRFVPPVTTPLAVTADLDANQLTVVVPRTVSNPSGTWRAIVAAGLYDPLSGGWLRPQSTADADTPGGAGLLDLTPSGIFNQAFRFDELNCLNPPDTLNCDMPPDTDQALAIRNKTPATFAHAIDFAALDANVNSSTVPATGTQVRIFPSRLDLGEGREELIEGPNVLNPPFPAFKGQLQPYSLYVPTTYSPATPAPLTLNMHSLGECYWQYHGATMVQQIGEQRGNLVATPLARGQDGWYQHEAEYDVFEVWADIAQHFNLDSDHVASSGYSMGGYATYRLPGLYPDLFGKAFSQVGPPGDGVWLPPAPPTGGIETLSNLWLANVRNVPYMNVAAAQDELVPIVGPEAQNLGNPGLGIVGFDQLGYRFRFLTVLSSDHFAQASAGYNYPLATDFLGDAAIDRNPPHVTFTYVPDSDDVSLDLIHDHAYWISEVTLASLAGAPALGTIDVRSHGYGVGDPPSTSGAGGGLLGIFPYVEVNRSWGAAPAIPVENLADVTLTNIGSARIDLARAALDPATTLTLPTTSDGDAVLNLDGVFPPGRAVFEDGVLLPGGSAGAGGAVVPVNAGTHTYVIAPAPVCAPVPAVGCSAPAVPRKAALFIRDGSPGKERLSWKWLKGSATTVGDFGNPLATTGYNLCIYDGTGTLRSSASAPAGDTCNADHTRPCWRAKATGFVYRDKFLTPNGLQKIALKAGSSGAAKIVVKGKGSLLDVPALPITSLPILVQLNNSDGECWEATYSSTILNQVDRLKAKAD